MKNIILALMLVFGFASLSTAGDCVDGICRVPLQPVRKVVTISKNIVVAPFRSVLVAAPKSVCEPVVSSDSCNCGCSTSTKRVVKYQPLRRRLVNRSTIVSCCQ